VTVFVPTRRPARLEHCIEQFRAQTYPNKELVLVVNTRSAAPEKIAALRVGNPDIRIYCVSEERNVGTCINLAIDAARGVHCVKMDDDDWYGENYVLDMVRTAEAVGAGVYGKPPFYIYLASTDRTYRREAGTFENCVLESSRYGNHQARVSGATLSGRTEVLAAIGFSSKNRGAVDSAFAEAIGTADISVYSLDGYGTVCFRSADPNDHTWQVEDRNVIAKSKLLGEGLVRDLTLI
jgi:glycosyltransferase involved in cell wall biosynthesis